MRARPGQTSRVDKHQHAALPGLWAEIVLGPGPGSRTRGLPSPLPRSRYKDASDVSWHVTQWPAGGGGGPHA